LLAGSAAEQVEDQQEDVEDVEKDPGRDRSAASGVLRSRRLKPKIVKAPKITRPETA
jgi:hypothetical protein